MRENLSFMNIFLDTKRIISYIHLMKENEPTVSMTASFLDPVQIAMKALSDTLTPATTAKAAKRQLTRQNEILDRLFYLFIEQNFATDENLNPVYVNTGLRAQRQFLKTYKAMHKITLKKSDKQTDQNGGENAALDS
jgi:hypothetical protein